MEDKNFNIDKALINFFSGQANADDTKTLMEWLNDSQENKKYFEEIKKFWTNSRYQVSMNNADEAFNRIKGIVENETPSTATSRNYKTSNEFSYGWWKVAAVLFIFISVGSYFYLQKTTEQPLIVEEVTLLKSANRPGEKSRIRLSDGTIVWLNSESTIEYPREFDTSSREVVLNGEAYFEVARDTLRPFIVTSGNIITTALGTSFNIKYFEEDDELMVSLVTGKIKVALDHSNSFFLEPGFQILYNRINKTSIKQKFHKEHAIAWTEGVLVFDKNNYSEVIKKLERWYGVIIKTEGNPPPDFTLTGQFYKNESLESVLETLNYGRTFQYSIRDKEIKIMFN